MTRIEQQRTLARDERGVALAIALLCIVLIGGLVTGTFFAARMEMGAGRNSVYNGQATEAAETGIQDAITNWSTNWNSYAISLTATSQGDVYPISGNASVRYTNSVRRLAGGNFLITSTGTKLDRNGNVMATRMLAKFAKLVKVDMDIKAAVTANAHVQVSGNTTKVDGYDALPPGWTTECVAPVPLSGVYGIRTSQQVGENGNPDIDGTPAPTKENDATVTSAMFLDPYNAFTPLANLKITGSGTVTWTGMAPSTTGSPARCNKTDSNNWGEPYRTGGYVSQCTDYFPVIWYSGSGTLKLTNGRAQGIILSANNIDIAGNFEFDGIMLALGSVDTHGTGNKVSGAVLSGNANISDDDAIAGTPTIIYSSCAIQKVLSAASRGVALKERNWAQVNPR